MATQTDPMTEWPDWMPDWRVYYDTDGAATIVNSEGVPVPSAPPLSLKEVDGVFHHCDPWGRPLDVYEPPTTEVFVYEDPSTGEFRVVHGNGQPVPSPPSVQRSGSDGGEFVAMAPDGSQVAIPTYEPPTTHVFVYEDPSTGEFQVVDKGGHPVPSPPWVQRWGVDEFGTSVSYPQVTSGPLGPSEFVAMAPDGSQVPIPRYAPWTTGVLVYEDPSTGEFQVVDGDGRPMPSPPWVQRSGSDGGEFVAMASDGSKWPLAKYEPPTTGVFVYEDPSTGEFQVVDGDGQPVPSPPWVQHSGPDGGEFVAMAPDGSPVTIPRYEPPTWGLFAVQDPSTGEFKVVDVEGNSVPYPPQVQWNLDASMGPDVGGVVVTPDGSRVAIPFLWPPPGEPPAEWPPSELGGIEESSDQTGEDEEIGAPAEAESDTSSGAAGEVAQPVEPTAEESAQEAEGGPSGGRGAFSEGEEVSSRYAAVEMEEGPVVLDGDATEDPRTTNAVERGVVSVTGLTADEFGELVAMDSPEGIVVGRSVGVGGRGETVSVIPNDLPMPPSPEDEADDGLGEVIGARGETVSATPIDLAMPPSPEDEADDGLGEVIGARGERVSAIPIDLAMPSSPEDEADDGLGEVIGARGETVSAVPMNLRMPLPPEVEADEGPGEIEDEGIELAESAGEPSIDDVSATLSPIPPPSTLAVQELEELQGRLDVEMTTSARELEPDDALGARFSDDDEEIDEL